MLQHIHAIYEDGVFKPLEPLTLPDHQRVWLNIAFEHTNAVDVVQKQRRAMEELDAEIDSLPDHSPNDDFAAADHDRLLYGGPA